MSKEELINKLKDWQATAAETKRNERRFKKWSIKCL